MDDVSARVRDAGGTFVAKVAEILDPEALGTVLDEVWTQVDPVQHHVRLVDAGSVEEAYDGTGCAHIRGHPRRRWTVARHPTTRRHQTATRVPAHRDGLSDVVTGFSR